MPSASSSLHFLISSSPLSSFSSFSSPLLVPPLLLLLLILFSLLLLILFLLLLILLLLLPYSSLTLATFIIPAPLARPPCPILPVLSFYVIVCPFLFALFCPASVLSHPFYPLPSLALSYPFMYYVCYTLLFNILLN